MEDRDFTETGRKKAAYLTAEDAAQELGISVATLYAYVSRGLIRSEAAGGSKRSRRPLPITRTLGVVERLTISSLEAVL